MDPTRTDYPCVLACIDNAAGWFQHNATNGEPDAGRCGFIETQDACAPGSIFNYYSMYYCDFYHYGAVGRIILVVVVSVLILFVLMYNLSSTADNYLAPALEYLTIRFSINESLAGVTLLAFGNGAPDVFSAISANTGSGSATPDPNDTLLSICGLVGGTAFLSSVV